MIRVSFTWVTLGGDSGEITDHAQGRVMLVLLRVGRLTLGVK
jgi:hypothetical protein